MNRLLIATLIALPTLAPAQTPTMTAMLCFEAGRVAEFLHRKHGELPAGMAETQDGGLFVFYLDPEDNSFSLSIVPASKQGKVECVLASGQNFFDIEIEAKPNL